MKQFTSSFGGSDITAVLGGKIIATLQAVSYSTSREKGPIYTLGDPNPRAFARGKRAIAGTLVFLMIHEDPILNHFDSELDTTRQGTRRYYGNKAASNLQYAAETGASFAIKNEYDTLFSDIDLVEAGDERQQMPAIYADQLLPFDINISAANEEGQVAKKSILGVELMNEGGGFSIDDLVIEQQYSYIARSITPWVKVRESGRQTWGSLQ